ncbi:type I restriction endonuclease subunit R [Salisediminibacterium beveridgei]|uniref:Type I restriction-modification system, restriction subunit R n=1 Tax=Salisediminibacterium beveridgei TaxID=632773 RepID=A0A1D7QZT0_9BACI|nr:DEAD/DEAH box helicase family protein [Salisediminibacterium beveridgei]AOM84470.1 Type I restriction-modification system, restriction subunit R [Salisediminibacterium beveridgei]
MSIDYSERGFEENIEQHLMESGYRQRALEGRALETFQKWAIDQDVLFEFLESTQPQSLERLKKAYKDDYEFKIMSRLDKELKKRGMIDCLRHGIKDYGVTLKLAYNKPVTDMNRTLVENYEKNIFTVSRQVYYSQKNRNSIDMMLSLNGLPIVVKELKNQLTNQTVEHSMEQFKKDRDPREILFQFKARAVVYFAVDTDEVHMATRLSKDSTFFLPFNRGNDGGKGNPPVEDDYRSSYLWKEILQKDSLLDILFRFVYVQKEDMKDSNGDIIETKEVVIFPRFHQLDAVRKIEQDVSEHRAGKNYLIQHSAGSGKTNSISWLSHRLAKLHDEQDEPVFDSVIVITDRRVLDKQLQDAVYQLEHKAGMVAKIDRDSAQLAGAIRNKTKIIITTLQKFPFILEEVGSFNRGSYAVIIDEAHSSQGGKASGAMTSILSDKTLEEAYEESMKEEHETTDAEERMIEHIAKTGDQDNISFFAFTATPKPKTIDRFGTEREDGQKGPFHLYSMRQAIEEGFIHDVLNNYVTYDTFYRVEKMIHDDPEVAKSKASKQIARYVSLHPHNIAQKAEIMVEHFRNVTRHKINNRAKAMVVTGSRKHAVRYKFAFDDYIKAKGYTDMRTLVAFSGTVEDNGESYTEPDLNSISEKELPEQFHSDDYQVLIVAEKYQTGFDEPLLHTMYVDKPLDGIKAVQTLSRLNRTCKGKDDTFILDFVNEPETIQQAFQQYYEVTTLAEDTDPNMLYDLQHELDAMQVYTEEELESVANLEYSGNTMKDARMQLKLNASLDPAVERFKNDLVEEEQEAFKSAATKFVRTYAFVLQIGPFSDVDLHKRFIFLTYLLKKLPKKPQDPIYISDDVALEYYRNEKVFEGSISLNQQGGEALSPAQHGTAGSTEEEKERLSSIIERINERFGTYFTDADRLSRDQIAMDIKEQEEMAEKAKNNSIDNFKYSAEKSFLDSVISRMNMNEEFHMRILQDPEFKEFLMNDILNEVYRELRDGEGPN